MAWRSCVSSWRATQVRRAQEPLNKRWKWECEQLHDYVLFMANTGLRPDEAMRLEHRDVSVVKDQATGEIGGSVLPSGLKHPWSRSAAR